MPNLEEHCKRTQKRYGVEGRDIHEWLDTPSRKYGGAHRQFRHDTETIRLVGEIFGKKYGKSLAENIALDHIMLDHEGEIEKRRTIVVKFPEKKEIPSIPCSFCSTLLKPSDQFCPKCGASRTKIIEKFDRIFEMEKIKLQEKKKKLKRELKLELALGELTQEQRVYLWKWSDLSFSIDKEKIILAGELEDFTSYLNGWETDLPSDQKKVLEKLGLYKPFGKVILDKLVQEDFKKHPELKEQVHRDIKETRVKAKKITEKILNKTERRNKTKWWR